MGAVAASPGEHSELPADLQRELRELEARGDRLTHYELLAIHPDADGASVRRAYLERSKRFHPDAWFGKNLGWAAAVLPRWFQKLSAAYQVLADEELRAAYDEAQLPRLSQDDRAAVERRAAARGEEERRERERRERLLRTKGFARIAAGRKLLEDAEEHARNGERAQAIAALKAARELDPNRREIAARLLELEREQSRARAASALASAKDREARREWAQALQAYIQAFSLDSSSREAALGAARCAWEQNQLPLAGQWAQRALDLQPGDVAVRLLLARALIGAGHKVRARAELAKILSVESSHPEARALLKTL